MEEARLKELKELKRKLEKLGLAKSRGRTDRLASRVLLKRTDRGYYFAWLVVSALREPPGYRLSLVLDVEDAERALEIAAILAMILESLRAEGYS
jgi:hypothetical protein